MNILSCEICGDSSVLLDKHHIVSKSKGGDNKPHNIGFLCPSCHRKVHTGMIVLEGRFQTTRGNELIYHKKGEESITDFLPPEVYVI